MPLCAAYAGPDLNHQSGQMSQMHAHGADSGAGGAAAVVTAAHR